MMKTLTQPRPALPTRILGFARQMDWFRGLRAAVALCAPMVLGDLAGIPNLGWAGLGGFEAIIADSGGPYRSRMSSLATLSLGGAVGLFLGSVVGGNLLWALPVTLLWCFLWSYLAVLGQPFSSAGILVQVVYICGIGAPTSSWHLALNHSLLLLAGGAWAAVLSLLLWPLDAYRPARAAVSECYRELASFLASIAELSGAQRKRIAENHLTSIDENAAENLPQPNHPPAVSARNRQNPALWHRLARHHQYRVRRAVELGWQAVAAIRAGRRSETVQGHHLVVLLEHADLLIARTVALADHMEAQAQRTADEAGPCAPCLECGLACLVGLRATDLGVADLLVRRRGKANAQALRQKMEQLPLALEDCLGKPDATGRFLLAQVTESASLLATSIESATLLRRGRPLRTPIAASASHFGYVYERLGQLRQGWNLGRIVDQLYANFTRDSLLLRHAARVAVVCGLDVALIFLFHIDHGYWLLLTSLIVLQPHVSGTMRRGLERIGGTVAGGILAALLAATLHSQLATAAALFPLALLALAILPVNYTAFCFFLTPTFVLAWLPFSGDWQLALVRTGNTVLGAVISVAAMHFLFPSYERDRAPEFLRASIRADRLYLEQLAASWRGHSRSSRLIAAARRSTGLAHNDTEESMDRLLAESWPRRRPFAQFVAAFVTYLRRFAQSVTVLATLDDEWGWKQSGPVQSRLDLLNRRLEWLEEQARSGAAPLKTLWPEPTIREMQSPIPILMPTAEHPGERQLELLERQTEILHRQLITLRQHGWIPGIPKQ